MEKQKIICDNCKGEILNPNWQKDNLTYNSEKRIEVIYCNECKQSEEVRHGIPPKPKVLGILPNFI